MRNAWRYNVKGCFVVESDRMAVGRRAFDVAQGQTLTGTRFVLDDDGMLQYYPQALGKRAGYWVQRTTG